MKLFIDTSNSHIIIAIFNNKKVVHYLNQEVTGMAKNAPKIFNDFLKENEIDLKYVEGLYTTIGPGSFTGMKVGLNILKSINLFYKVNTIGYISTFDLLGLDSRKTVILPFGKKKLFVQKYIFRYIKLKKIEPLKYKEGLELNKYINAYEDFKRQQLEDLFLNKNFKSKKNINDIDLMYMKIKLGN